MRLLPAFVAILLLAGCQQRVAPRSDRDIGALMTALQQVDPCELLGQNRPIKQAGPHSCVVGDDDPKYMSVRIIRVDDTVRYNSTRVTLSGAKAYKPGTCNTNLPITADWVVEFQDYISPDDQRCAVTERIATVAAAKLATPPTGPPDPFRQWDACGLFNEIVSLEPGSRLSGQHIDTCHLIPPEPPYKQPSKASITLTFAPNPATGPGSVKWIANRPVRLAKGERDLCELSWSMGASGSPDPKTSDKVVTLLTPNCALGEQYARKAITMLAKPRNIAPQQPLLYPPNEPDTRADQACLNLRIADCQHYDWHTIGADLNRARELTPDALCSAAFSPMQSSFRLRDAVGVTADNRCVLTQADAVAQVWISAEPDRALPAGQRGEIAGHAVVFGVNEVHVAIDGGLLHIELKNLPGRQLEAFVTDMLR